MNPARRFLALTPGSPMNPVSPLMLAYFAVVPFGFSPFMPRLGMGWEVALVEAVVLAAAVACIALAVWIARRYASDHARLLAGDCWARWSPTPEERVRFLGQERQRARSDAARYTR